MVGVKSVYTAANADVVLKYWRWRWCKIHLWFPTGYRTRTNMRWKLFVPGGGWDDAKGTVFANDNDPHGQLLPGGGLDDVLLSNGWVIGRIQLPVGYQANPYSRFRPCSRWPFIPEALRRACQIIVSNALNGRITGSRASTLSQTDFGLEGSSAGGIESVYSALQPENWISYDKSNVNVGGDSPFTPRLSGKPKFVVNGGGIWDFSKFSKLSAPTNFPGASGVSAEAISRFGCSERFVTSPKFSSVPRETMIAASTMHLLQRYVAENKGLAIFQDFSDGSGAHGSFLGSGTTVEFTGSVTGGTIQVGDRAEGVTSGAIGTVKRFDAGAKNFLYIERDNTTQYIGGALTETIRKQGGGGWSFSTDTSANAVAGNNNRLAFLSGADALAAWDAALDGPIDDLISVHECLNGLASARQLALNDAANGVAPVDSLHRNYVANAHVAAMTSGIDGAAFVWNGLDYATTVYAWLANVVGIP